MKYVRLAEYIYIKKHLRVVRHITLDPNGPGVIRIHMVPPKSAANRYVPYVLILNGQDILPIGVSWAILLANFMDAMEGFENKELTYTDWENLVKTAVTETKKTYSVLTEKFLRSELKEMLDLFQSIARGEKSAGETQQISLSDYAVHMSAPHRMDLMVSAMTQKGVWHCNQKCIHCYAAGQSGSETPELSTSQWKEVLSVLRKANIPQVTFTGGEPTMRPDLVELVRSAQWFVTRLNTNGRLLTPELCKQLYEASLDSVQVTLYSYDETVHNTLVGAPGFSDTVQGIKNALAAGLNLSINTPLCTLNKNYTATLKFANSLGIRYVTCSGLIPGGNALTEASAATKLEHNMLVSILKEAIAYCKEAHMEISFTSPGWLTEKDMYELRLLHHPSCGACLSNMAIRPDGVVIPCQSWLSGEGLGNILSTPWAKIWNSTVCTAIRARSAQMEGTCQLRSGNKEGGTCR